MERHHGDESHRRPGSPVHTAAPSARTTPAGRDSAGPGRAVTSVRGRVSLILLAGFLSLGAVHHWDPAPDPSGTTGRVVAPAASELAPSLELPVEVNERVDAWIQRFLTEQRPTLQAFLSRESLYGPMIRAKLRERGMPEDLLYMAMIESGFSSGATSPVEASGLWQFMGPTARDYGLEIGTYVDERRDPVRATDAALDYLAELHERFGSWYLAAAAYNAGPNRVARSLRRYDDTGSGDGELFWEIVDDLPTETRHYVPKLLAATLLAKRAEEYGFEVEKIETYEFDRVWVPGETSLERISRAVDASPSLLRGLNPHLVRGVTPPGTSYGVRVPPGSVPQVVASLGGRWAVADD